MPHPQQKGHLSVPPWPRGQDVLASSSTGPLTGLLLLIDVILKLGGHMYMGWQGSASESALKCACCLVWLGPVLQRQ